MVATGRPGLVSGEMVKPGAVVLDFGMNRGPDGKLVGDVDFATVSPSRAGDHAGAGRGGP